MNQAEPRADISEPPAYPVIWLVLWNRRVGKSVRVVRTVLKCRTWFDVRERAMRSPGVEAHQLRIIQGERDHVDYGRTRYTIEKDLIKMRPIPKTVVKKPKRRK